MNSIYYHLALSYLQLIGIFLFIALYFYAASIFPGGSQLSLETKGFDWMSNYWCNLLNKQAMNGEFNPSRPYAICGMITVCLSLSLFFYQFSTYLASTKRWKNAIKFGGVLSMLTAVFLFTKYHDLITSLSSLFGLIAAVGIIVEVYATKQDKIKVLGFVIILLLLVNNVIYYTKQLIEWLPIIQKITFVMFFVWVIVYNFRIRKIIKSLEESESVNNSI